MDINNFLDYASKRYYEGNPIITDDEFDSLVDKYSYHTVGHSIRDGIPHQFRMYSLQKIYKGESEPPFSGIDIIQTPKLDGAAISLTYVKSKLVRILTRGDGINGQDVSHLIPKFPAPKWLHTIEDIIQVDGELVAPKTIPNARNYASGAISLKDLEEFQSRDLTFFAYSIQPYGPIKTYADSMSFLDDNGFNTVCNVDTNIYPTDGEVFRVNKFTAFELLGYTSHHPRGAYALKERKEGVITKLIGVTWQVGKTGAVSPVALLEPVEIGGAIVSRATLHNMKYINELELEIGCDVEVIRAGEIIPRVVRKVS